MISAPRKRRNLRDRFNEKIRITPGCWLWLGARNNKGYGQVTGRRGRNVLAHRASYELHFGHIPDGHMVLHRCDNPACVNPDHLFTGTAKDNTQDMMQKGRQKVPQGAANHRAKLTEEQVQAIRQETGSIRSIARKYGVTHGAITPILSGKSWKTIKGKTA